PLRLIENSIVGPVIAMASFICSVGNIPLASWLWSNGIGFGGVVSFIYADLIIIPILMIYRKYYGGKAAAYIAAVLFVSMVLSGLVVHGIFSAVHLIPHGPRPPGVMETAHFAWGFTTWLDLAALAAAGWFFIPRPAKSEVRQIPGHGMER
ncbi:MAG: permease, partial [Opitutaceae bacterium]